MSRSSVKPLNLVGDEEAESVRGHHCYAVRPNEDECQNDKYEAGRVKELHVFRIRQSQVLSVGEKRTYNEYDSNSKYARQNPRMNR